MDGGRGEGVWEGGMGIEYREGDGEGWVEVMGRGTGERGWERGLGGDGERDGERGWGGGKGMRSRVKESDGEGMGRGTGRGMERGAAIVLSSSCGERRCVWQGAISILQTTNKAASPWGLTGCPMPE